LAGAAELDVDPQDNNAQAVKNSGIISVFKALGFISALLLDIVIAAHFGLSAKMDAFFVAYALPQMIASILLVASNVVLVPILTKVTLDQGPEGLWRLSSNLMNLGLVILGLVGAIAILSSPVLMEIQGAGLDDGARELAVSLNRLLFLTVVPLGAVEVSKAVLNSLRSFAFPAVVALVKNIGTLLFVLLFDRWLDIYALALGYAVASWLALVFLGAVLRAKGFRYHRVLDWREERTIAAFKQMRFPFVGAVLGQSNILVERFLATFLPPGTVSALAYARRVFRALTSMFIGNISTVFLPRLSAQFVRREIAKFEESVSLALKLGVFIAFPLGGIVFGLSVLIVDLIYGRGAFDLTATLATAGLLNLYVLSLPVLALDQVFRSAFYALEDTRTPFVTRAITLAVNIGLDTVLFFLLGAWGLALALTLARIVGTYIVARRFYAKHSSLAFDLVRFSGKVGLASILVGGSLLALEKILFRVAPWVLSGFMHVAVWLSVGITGGSALFLWLVFLFRVPEVHSILAMIRKRVFVSSQRSNAGPP